MKKTVLLLFGGKSPEHEISVKTGYNVAQAIDKTKFDIELVGVSRKGCFQKVSIKKLEEMATNYQEVLTDENEVFSFSKISMIDVVFPLLHGISGEDGIPQGFLNMLNIPFVGSDVKASSMCMDKDITKKLLKNEGIPVVDWIILEEDEDIYEEEIIVKLGLPLFIKAAEQGSSIGTYKANTKKEVREYIEKAFKYGPKVIIEKGLKVREIEVAILGNGNDMQVSNLGEIIPSEKHEFYSYDAKYMDPNGAKITTDVTITKEQTLNIKTYAKKAFKTLGCKGLARIDFFIDENNSIYLNEINTMPGFTNISMYPKLWMKEGISYQDLITKLIDLAFDHFNKKNSYSLV